MKSMRSARYLVVAAAVALIAGIAIAVTITPTPKQVTNTTGGKCQNTSIDKSGKLIVFTANVSPSLMFSDAGTFDFDGTGNDFKLPTNTAPTPTCVNCSNADGNGELYLWRLKAKGTDPSNSIRQLTNTTGSAFAANNLPDINQKGTVVAWDSDRDHTGGNAGNDQEIFVEDLTTNAITQITSTTGGGNAGNRSVNLSDDGKVMVWDSNRDWAAVGNCTLVDGTTACGNSSGASQIMLYDVTANHFTQITTSAAGSEDSIRARVSSEGKFVAFQTTNTLASLANCTLADGVTACNNSDQNGEIVMWDRVLNHFTQITSTPKTGSCSSSNSSERVEISKAGKYVTFQSTCEFYLNPTGCAGSCDGSDNDEAFVYDTKAKKLTQVTLSVPAKFNRVPRISGGGAYIIWESNASYKNLNPSHQRVLYIIKRSTKAGTGGFTGAGQVIADDETGFVQSAKTKLLAVSRSGGFNSSIEQIGVATGGRFFSFDNAKGVGNQEVWFIDRNK
jgi:hypothetical protein